MIHVAERRNAGKDERRHAVADRAQETGKKVIKERRRDTGEDHGKVRPHERGNALRHLQKPQKGGQERIGERREEERTYADETERVDDAPPETALVAVPAADGEKRARAHRKPQQYRREEDHKRIRAPHGGERVTPDGVAAAAVVDQVPPTADARKAPVFIDAAAYRPCSGDEYPARAGDRAA